MYESNYMSTNSQNKIVFVKYLNLCFYCMLCVNFSQENTLSTRGRLNDIHEEVINYQCYVHQTSSNGCHREVKSTPFYVLTSNLLILWILLSKIKVQRLGGGGKASCTPQPPSHNLLTNIIDLLQRTQAYAPMASPPVHCFQDLKKKKQHF